eukprot:2209531-Rhodomonas_salina.2
MSRSFGRCKRRDVSPDCLELRAGVEHPVGRMSVDSCGSRKLIQSLTLYGHALALSCVAAAGPDSGGEQAAENRHLARTRGGGCVRRGVFGPVLATARGRDRSGSSTQDLDLEWTDRG